MKVIGILNQKGGVGKTTLATCLSVAFESHNKKVALIDLDPQATSCFWSDIRKQNTPAVVSIQPVRLKSIIQGAKEAKTDIVIIDGAAIQKEIAYDVAQVADYVLIPTKPAVFDVTSMQETIQILQQNKTPYSVILNMISPSGQEINDFKKLTKDLNIPLCDVSIGNRKDFFRAQNIGLAVQEYDEHCKGAEEIIQVYKYINKQIYK
jgi:chromosome partitioning protein